MRKIIVGLVALVALAAAQPAAAAPVGDDPAATFTPWDYGSGKMLTCVAPHKVGVYGQYGASGHYIAGCTVQLPCPTTVRGCTVASESRINNELYRGSGVTMNSRIRSLRPSGAVYGWRDRSCAGTDWCLIEDATTIAPGESASVQCNGVRKAGHNRTQVRCTVDLRYIR